MRYPGKFSVFLDKALPMIGAPIDLDRYADLFTANHGLISGDVTLAYSTLPQDVINRIATRFRDLKTILLVRNPLERVVVAEHAGSVEP